MITSFTSAHECCNFKFQSKIREKKIENSTGYRVYVGGGHRHPHRTSRKHKKGYATLGIALGIDLTVFLHLLNTLSEMQSNGRKCQIPSEESMWIDSTPR